MLNDPILQPRKLEKHEDIFDIIMPWVPDYNKEQQQFQIEMEKLGLVETTSKPAK